MGMIRAMSKLREFYRREKMLFIKASKFEKVLLLLGLLGAGYLILSLFAGVMLGLYWSFFYPDID